MAKDEINAFMGMGTTYQGKLVFKGTVRIDGEFEGEIESDGTLIVGNEAHVRGTINVGQLVLSGALEGDLKAQAKVVLYKQANISGKITTPTLVVEEGAVVKGEINMSPETPEVE
ncbi:bactofilin family protein [Desulfonatronovibrio hydrogenovorans]|uniref:bactofilin family protein n=1 Tax=Desulfonatronovibrio hydrogenovorans TaxID=53245 RepID=UPI00049134BF|nr:polymer-forming cytoskeletal protein [Desulfonatronovibrio hydrogenovorans]